jgi:hypothetical protein
VATLIFIDRPSKKYNNYTLHLAYDSGNAAVKKLKADWEKRAEAVRQKAIKDAQAAKKGVAAAKALEITTPISEEMDEETGEPTGRLIIKAKTSAEYKDKKTNEMVAVRVPVFDAKAKPVKGRTKAGKGTIAKISGTLSEYVSASIKKAGLTLYLDAVQILELVEYGGDGSSYGFEAEEDGYDAEAAAADDDDDAFGGEGEGDESSDDADF